MFAERVDKLTRRNQIERSPRQIVPTFESWKPHPKKVIDGGHAWPTNGRQNRPPRFLGYAAGRSAWTTGFPRLDVRGRRHGLYREFISRLLKLDIVAFPIGGSSPQAFGGLSGRPRPRRIQGPKAAARHRGRTESISEWA